MALSGESKENIETEKLYEEGMDLILKCSNELDEIKGKIVKIEQDIDGVINEQKL